VPVKATNWIPAQKHCRNDGVVGVVCIRMSK